MKKTIYFVLLMLSFIALLISGCKKEKAIEVYFTSSSANVNRADAPTVVNIEFSEATTEIVEIDF